MRVSRMLFETRRPVSQEGGLASQELGLRTELAR